MQLHVRTIFMQKKHRKIEIWGKAQREFARRPKSDLGDKFRGVKFPR